MKKTKIFFLLLALCALLIIIFLTVDRLHEPLPVEISWRSPGKNVYLIQSDASANISMGQGNEMKMNQTFASRMALKALSEDETGIYAVARFLQPEYRVLGQLIPLRISDANVVLNFGRGGEIRRLFFPASFSESEIGLLTQIFQTVEIHLAPQAEGWEWSAVHDPVEADYRFSLSGRTLSRKTLRYSNRDAKSVRVLSSDFSCELSPIFWIDNVSAYEEKSMEMDFAESSGYMALKMKRVSPMPSDTALWNETDDLRAVFAKMRESDRSTERGNRERQLTSQAGEATASPALSAEQIARYLDEVIPALSIENYELVDEYALFLSENPDAVKMLPRWLLDNGGSITDTQHSIFMFALEKCGSSEAQSVLAILASDERYGDVDNARAIVALGGVRHIEDASIRFLQATSRKTATERERVLANTAILNLGAAANLLRDSDPIAYGDLLAGIRKDLHNSRGDAERSAALISSLGNIRDNALLPDIAPYTESEESALRAAAYDALRFMEGEEAEKLIRKGVETERSDEARLALSGALAYRKPDPETVGIVMNSVKGERDSFVINNMLGYVYRAPDNDGSIETFLRETMKNDSLPIDARRGVINELRKRSD